MSHLSRANKNNLFFSWLAVFTILELLSWLSYHYLNISWVVLILIALATIVFALIRPMYAIYIPLGELFWGSLGHSFDYGMWSTRLVIFLAVALYFVITHLLKVNKLKLWRDKTMSVLWALIIIAIAIAVLIANRSGVVNENIFLDANAYLYIFYLPVWYQVYQAREVKNIFVILKAAALVIAVKTIVVFNIFVQDYKFLDIESIYKWIRDSRTGEITPMSNGFFRVFMQSQFYLLPAWFFVFLRQLKDYRNKSNFIYLVIISTAILLSLSRSLWLGAAVALLFILFIIFFYQRRYISPFIFVFLIGLGISSFLAVQVFFNLPRWQSVYTLVDRTATTTEPAASSRAELLPVMWDSIKERPLTGQGFGKELTYKSSDPRIKNENNSEGWHTTYAFEWGWLDIWLKGGLLLVACFLGWLWLIYQRAYRFINQQPIISFTLVSSLLSLIVIHIFTPYINHPLGLGLMMIATVIFTIHVKHQTNSYY